MNSWYRLHMKYDTVLPKLNTAHMGFHVQSSSHKFRDCTFNTSQSAMSVHNCKLQTAHSCLQIKCRWYVSLSGLYHAVGVHCTLEVCQPVCWVPGDQSTSGLKLVVKGESSVLIPSSSSPCAQHIIWAMFNLPAEAVVLNQFEDVFHSNLSNFMGVDQEIQSQGIRFSNPLPREKIKHTSF